MDIRGIFMNYTFNVPTKVLFGEVWSREEKLLLPCHGGSIQGGKNSCNRRVEFLP